MNFATLTGNYLTLRAKLAAYVGPHALQDITVHPPAKISDELSFLRLVAWGYALLHESGKTTLPFLRDLPPWSEPGVALLPHVRALRTWSSHNLSFNKTSDVNTIRVALQWLTKTCGTGSPGTSAQWKQCFLALANDLDRLVRKAIASCDSFEKSDDRDALVAELSKRLNRNWDAYRFDEYAQAASDRLGYFGLDAKSIRDKHLNEWRAVVAASTDADIDRNLRLRIERDVLRLVGDALPTTADELDSRLKFGGTEQLVAALLVLAAQDPSSRLSIIDRLDNAQQSLAGTHTSSAMQ